MRNYFCRIDQTYDDKKLSNNLFGNIYIHIIYKEKSKFNCYTLRTGCLITVFNFSTAHLRGSLK